MGFVQWAEGENHKKWNMDFQVKQLQVSYLKVLCLVCLCKKGEKVARYQGERVF